ncbi:hypothetical protein AB1Y20_005854 [Prymnesium parvum]|uniref:DZANK-type domain-containing protein n=1 Tax=Prymnesium parvum TaxID=97485 RepID=A0AB34J0Y5_PRYPA
MEFVWPPQWRLRGPKASAAAAAAVGASTPTRGSSHQHEPAVAPGPSACTSDGEKTPSTARSRRPAVEIESRVAAEHFLCAVHIGRPDLMTAEFLAIIENGAHATLQDAGHGFWSFGGYHFRKPLRLGVEWSGASAIFAGSQVAGTLFPPLGIAMLAAGLGFAAVAVWKQNAEGTRTKEELFEERYKFPLEQLQSGKAWASDWWDLEEGDGWLDMVLKCKWSPLWTDEQKDRLIKRLVLRVLSLCDEPRSLKVMRLAKAVSRSRRAMTRFRWGRPPAELNHRWLAASECLGEIVEARGTRFEALFAPADETDAPRDPDDLILVKRIQTAYALCAHLEAPTVEYGLASRAEQMVICPQCGHDSTEDVCPRCAQDLVGTKEAWAWAVLSLQRVLCPRCGLDTAASACERCGEELIDAKKAWATAAIASPLQPRARISDNLASSSPHPGPPENSFPTGDFQVLQGKPTSSERLEDEAIAESLGEDVEFLRMVVQQAEDEELERLRKLASTQAPEQRAFASDVSSSAIVEEG